VTDGNYRIAMCASPDAHCVLSRDVAISEGRVSLSV
jgi:hypothetical protein